MERTESGERTMFRLMPVPLLPFAASVAVAVLKLYCKWRVSHYIHVVGTAATRLGLVSANCVDLSTRAEAPKRHTPFVLVGNAIVDSVLEGIRK